MAIQIIDTFEVGTNKPVDTRIVKNTVEQALTDIKLNQRYNGLQVTILNPPNSIDQDIFWFDGGIQDAYFVPMVLKSTVGSMIENTAIKHPTTSENWLNNLSARDGWLEP